MAGNCDDNGNHDVNDKDDDEDEQESNGTAL